MPIGVTMAGVGIGLRDGGGGLRGAGSGTEGTPVQGHRARAPRHLTRGRRGRGRRADVTRILFIPYGEVTARTSGSHALEVSFIHSSSERNGHVQ